ncbi:MAG: LytTR family transcriptional regulator [Lachnospiraceae bacterium]|nr:LytTR family transcriptional regulator [Lachnospiraceae bacterium]
MFTMLIHSEDEEEREFLCDICKEVTAHVSNEKINIIYDISEADSEPECAIVNICEDDGLEYVKNIRNKFSNIEVMLIADAKISPMKYLNPQIRPISLAIKPYSKNEVEEVVGEFLHKLLAEEEGGMWIDTSDGKIKVQYNNILYLEASNKMLSLRLNSMEYNIYGSLDKFEKSLPDSFVRCHRSYIVNGTFISKVRFSENYLVLNNQIQIPLSRTYKQAIRGLMSNGHNEKEILS